MAVVYAQAPVQAISDTSITPGRLAAISTRSLQTMESRLGIQLKRDDLTARLCEDEASYRRAGGLKHTEACYLSPDRIIIRGQEGLSGDLAHEFAHVLIEEQTHGQCPKWLDEGIVNHENHITEHCQYSQRVMSRLHDALQELAGGDARWSLDGLSNDTQTSREMCDAFYGAAWFATDYLYRTYGRGSVLAALHDMATVSPNEALRRNLGKGLAELEREWRESLEVEVDSSNSVTLNPAKP
jgi:hypothetical protein